MNFKALTQSSFMLMIVIVVAKLIGMLRDVILANYFGTSNISDAYLVASSVPVLLFYFIGHSLSTAYIPMFNKVKHEKGILQALRFTDNLLTISLLLSTVIVVVLLLFSSVVVKLFAAGFDSETAQISAKLIRICAPSIYLMTIINICGGFLQASRNFLAPAAISLPRNIIIVVSVMLAASFGYSFLGWGLLVSYIFEFIFLLPFVLRKQYRYSPFLNPKDEYIKKTLYVVAPILLGMCVGQVNKIVDRSMASTIIVGGISALNYASIINNAVQEILVTGIITILFANCAELVAKGEHDKVKIKLSKTIDSLIFILLPAIVGVILLAEPIVELILCRGEFNQKSLQMTVGALRCYSCGLLFLALRDTLVKVFYAYKETKVTTIVSICAILINICLNIVLGKLFGINGLAIATSFSAMFNCIVLIVAFYKFHGNICFNNIMNNLAKCVICSIGMCICILLLQKLLNQLEINGMFSLFIQVLVGMSIYFLLSLCVRSSVLMPYIAKFVKL